MRMNWIRSWIAVIVHQLSFKTVSPQIIYSSTFINHKWFHLNFQYFFNAFDGIQKQCLASDETMPPEIATEGDAIYGRGSTVGKIVFFYFSRDFSYHRLMQKVQSLGIFFFFTFCHSITVFFTSKIDFPSENHWSIHLHSFDLSNLHKIQQAIKMWKCCISTVVLTALIKLYGKWMWINCLILNSECNQNNSS